MRARARPWASPASNLWAAQWLDCLDLHAESNMADATDVKIPATRPASARRRAAGAALQFARLLRALGSSDFQSPGVSLQPKRVNRLRELLSARLGVEVEVIEDR